MFWEGNGNTRSFGDHVPAGAGHTLVSPGGGRQPLHPAYTGGPLGPLLGTPARAQPSPQQKAVGAGELVLPDGLVRDQDAAHERHGESHHACCGQLRGWQKGKKSSVWGALNPAWAPGAHLRGQGCSLDPVPLQPRWRKGAGFTTE